MNILKKTLFILMALQIVVLTSVLVFFKTEDMTLGKGDISYFNQGWRAIFEDGRIEDIDSLPYHSASSRNETVELEAAIPKEYGGKTLFFLSADKTIKIFIDGKEAYSFGDNY